jgi:hypothetical protein
MEKRIEIYKNSVAKKYGLPDNWRDCEFTLKTGDMKFKLDYNPDEDFWYLYNPFVTVKIDDLKGVKLC